MAIDELEIGAQLDFANIAFLRLRQFGAAGEWASISCRRDLAELMALSPPMATREVVAKAVFRHALDTEAGLPSSISEWGAALAPIAWSVRRALLTTAAGNQPEGWFLAAAILLWEGRHDDSRVFESVAKLLAAGWVDAVRSIDALQRHPPSTQAVGNESDQAAGAEVHVSPRVEYSGQNSSVESGIAGVGATPAETLPSPLAAQVLGSEPAWSDNQQSPSSVALVSRPHTGADPLEAIREAFECDEIERAYLTALHLSPSGARAEWLVHCARWLDDQGSAREAVAAWEQLDDSVRAKLECRRPMRDTLRVLRERLVIVPLASNQAGPPASGWAGWFARLRVTEDWPGALSAAQRGLSNWHVDEVLASPEAVDEVVGVLRGQLPRWASDTVRCALPYLIDAFVRDSVDVRALSIFDELLNLLLMDASSDPTVPACDGAVDLFRVRVAMGLQGKAYQSALDLLCDAILQLNSPAVVPVALYGLEVLLFAPDSAGEVQRAAATRLVSSVARWERRLSRAQRVDVRALASDLGVACPLSEQWLSESPTPDQNVWDRLSGRYVAIYSLDENALSRAKGSLERLCPAVKVRTFAEYVATTSMTEAARNADLFVIVTKAAKHAATIAIERQLTTDRCRYAAGKGSSAIVTAVEQWLQQVV
jgi:hypothetical protein